MPTAEEFEGCWPGKVLEATSCGPVFLPVAEAASARGGLSPRRGLWLPWPTGLESSTLERLQEQAGTGRRHHSGAAFHPAGDPDRHSE